jgi:hypothetical protein
MRTQPAIFHATDAAGRLWTIRVGPLGIEAVTHDAREYTFQNQTFHCGQQHVAAWADILPSTETP